MKFSFQDKLTPVVQEAKDLLQGQRLNPALAAGVLKLFRAHMRELPKNRQGWPSQNYWMEAAKSAYTLPAPEGFSLQVPQAGFGMHVTGQPETIEPRNAKMLTIPAVPEAYGRRAGEFDLKITYYRKGGKLVPLGLMEKRDQSAGPKRLRLVTGKAVGRSQPGRIIFWLSEKVNTHKYSPSPIPSDDEIEQNLIQTTNARIAELKARHGV